MSFVLTSLETLEGNFSFCLPTHHMSQVWIGPRTWWGMADVALGSMGLLGKQDLIPKTKCE